MTTQRDESVVEAARRMADFGVGNLVVVDDEGNGAMRPIGIVTDRDLVVHVLASARSPASVKVSDVMSTELATVVEDDTVEAVLGKLRQNAIRRIPVVDRRGYLQGIVSLDDIVDWMAEQLSVATSLIERQRTRSHEARP